jgi:hypothetical protein
MFFGFHRDLGIEFFEREIALVPEFNYVLKDKSLGTPAFKYICMVYDNRSPYRHYVIENRKKKVLESLFGEKNHICFDGNVIIENAIKVYNDMQFDADVESYFSVNEQIMKLSDYLSKLTPGQVKHEGDDIISDLDEIKNTLAALKAANSIKDDLQKILSEKTKSGVRTEGGTKQSFLSKENSKQNQKNGL